MSAAKKIKIKIGIIGFLPFEFNEKLIKNWKSDVFEIVGNIDKYHFQTMLSDSGSWGYSDSNLERELPENKDADFFIGITNVQIQNNYYSRRLSGNRIVISYSEIYDILRQEHISVDSFLFREIY